MKVLNSVSLWLWMTVALLTAAAEILPAELSTFSGYLYNTAKFVLFLSFGFLIPLTFRRLETLSVGLLIAAGSAALIELSQTLADQGHRASLIEFGAKLLLILLGFALAVEARYQRSVSLGRWRFGLLSEHLPQR